MPVRKLREFLDRHGVKYMLIIHSKAYTAQEIAQLAHIPGRQLAKTVIVKCDGKMAMAVLPSLQRVNLERLKELSGAHTVEMAEEIDFKDKFPECEVGAMPPFGNLFGMEVFVEPALVEDEEIVFNAGSHTELMRLRYRDFARLVKPKVLEFAQ